MGFPIILTVALFILILIPFIAIIVAIALLILGLIKRDKMKQFALYSIGAFIISFITFLLCDAILASDTTDTPVSEETSGFVLEQVEEESTTNLIHPNETINELLTELNSKYGIGLIKDELLDQSNDSNGSLIETFRQVMSALSPAISNEEFNTLVSQLKTYDYQDYKKYTINDSDFTLNCKEVENEKIRYTIKG